jgi:S-formylglutathione hydrolase
MIAIQALCLPPAQAQPAPRARRWIDWRPFGLLSLGMALFAALAAPASAAPAPDDLQTGQIATRLVPGPARFTVLLPPGYAASGKPFPLILFLHGGDGDNGFLKRSQPQFEAAWARGDLPPAVVVTPDADRSLYMDYRDGSQKWDTFIVSELIPYIRAHYNVSPERSQTVVMGVSMGGLGSLTLAFRHPEVFGGLAALEAGIEPGLSFHDLKRRNHIQRDDKFFTDRFGDPPDDQWFKDYNPANLAIANRRRILDSHLKIYIDVGDNDMFYLDEGVEFLHRVLWDHEIPHQYWLVHGADHLGRSLPPRLVAGFQFLRDNVLAPLPPDNSAVRMAGRAMTDRMKAAAGVSDSDPRPALPPTDKPLHDH